MLDLLCLCYLIYHVDEVMFQNNKVSNKQDIFKLFSLLNRQASVYFKMI